MKNTSASMAHRAMVLLYLTLAVCMTYGCGAPVYEDVAESVPEQIPAEEAGSASEETGSTKEPESDTESDEIRVYICGAVQRSGVYVFSSGARGYEAVDAAGGLTESADETAFNQAALLSDGQEIVIPEKGSLHSPDPLGERDESSGADRQESKININTADAEELQKLTGIGASRAADIIAYRERCGPFGSIEDIMKVSGIKSAVFEKIKDAITVG